MALVYFLSARQIGSRKLGDGIRGLFLSMGRGDRSANPQCSEQQSLHNVLRLSRPIPDYTDVLQIILMICLAAAALAGDSKTAAKTKPPASQGTSAQEDKAIEAVIRAKLEKSKIGKDGFKVRVQGGVATWEGTTDVIQHKGAATRMAKTAGARVVVNNIKISDSAKQKATDNLEAGRRRAQVKRSDARE